ncbi:hypothetical protein HAX54_030817 [Datura stramonium]|uniref:Uncharacterized protein n=1 Tax=Datura stramonium TaxID=4076 RepID=A0ABS8V8J2_DATST|nr:hypothetical protein [Datura stramonium]
MEKHHLKHSILEKRRILQFPNLVKELLIGHFPYFGINGNLAWFEYLTGRVLDLTKTEYLTLDSVNFLRLGGKFSSGGPGPRTTPGKLEHFKLRKIVKCRKRHHKTMLRKEFSKPIHFSGVNVENNAVVYVQMAQLDHLPEGIW